MSQPSFTVNMPICVSALCNETITMDHVKQLRSNGFYTIQMVAEGDREKLLLSVLKNEEMCDLILARSYALLPYQWFVSGDVVHSNKSLVTRLTTGSSALDDILLGGIERGTVTEIFGLPGSGKTQFAMTVSVTCQLSPSLKGFGGKCIFIDTNNTFRTERILQIARRFDLDGQGILGNILYVPVKTSSQLNAAIDQINCHFQSNWIPLIVIDNYASIIQTEYQGTIDLNGRYRCLSTTASKIKDLAEKYLAAVLMTNTCYVQFGTNTIIPYGGKAMESLFATRLQMTKIPDTNRRTVKIYASSLHKEQICNVEINIGGVTD